MFLARAFDAFHEWGYTPVWSWKWITVRRIDPIIALFGIICTGYYWWSTGTWQGAVTGLLAYVFVAMVAMWIL